MADNSADGSRWASTDKVVLGCGAFVIWWILAVFPAVPCLPIGRTAGSILGAALMVVFQVISPTAAFDAVDLPILALLFGTMVISVYLERANMFRYLTWGLSWKSLGGKDLLCRVSILSAVCSAFFTNDTTCVVFTGFVLKLCQDKNLPPLSFLLALATNANIGSAGTAIGNPQNLVIAVQSGISFGKFLAGIVPAVLAGVVVNTSLLLICYWRKIPTDLNAGGRDIEEGRIEEMRTVGPPSTTLPEHSDQEGNSVPVTTREQLKEIQTEDINPSDNSERRTGPTGEVQARAHRRTSSPGRREPSEEGRTTGRVPEATEEPSQAERIKLRLKTISIYLITAGFLAALLSGLNLSWSAITAAVALMVVDFADAGPSLNKVSYSLLVFFSGMFIAVQGFNLTGAPGEFWSAVESHSHIDNAKGLIVLSLVVILLSNVASNVPTVLLLGSRVASSAAMSGASVTKAWLLLAWVSTVAGNLTLLGSAANLIVSEQARQSEPSYYFSFRRHLPFGVLSTLIVVAVGVPLFGADQNLGH